ncbi:APC family permease [Gorillibacterium sp. sgz5001074]|uniref:APC family permease n=1 Tax=Gorillibacterium sp. sgz5001074 TaxID=3446695 RepID=UPI003F666E79
MNKGADLRPTLSLTQVIALGLAWMTPMIYFSVFGLAYEAAKGAITEAYVLAVAAIFFTAYSYRIMARLYPASGSAYTYVKRSIHPFLGFLIGWAVLLDYLFSPIIAVLTFGIYLHAQFPLVPSAVWMLLFNAALVAVNMAGVRFSAGISKAVVLAQILFIVAFGGLLAGRLYAGGGGAVPFVHTGAGLPTLLSAASLVCFSFLGFDTVTTLSEETKDAGRTIPRAILWIIGVAAVLYVGVSFLIQSVYPGLVFADADSAGMELMRIAGGALLGALFITVLFMAIFTQGVTSVTSVSRLLYVMGRDRILPAGFFGYLDPKRGTPVKNIGLTGVISMLALVIPLEMAVKFVSFGALVSFAFVNMSVIAECYVRRKRRKPLEALRFLVFPMVGALFILWLLTLLDEHAWKLGSCWLVMGGAYYLFRMRQRGELASEPAAARTEM